MALTDLLETVQTQVLFINRKKKELLNLKV